MAQTKSLSKVGVGTRVAVELRRPDSDSRIFSGAVDGHIFTTFVVENQHVHEGNVYMGVVVEEKTQHGNGGGQTLVYRLGEVKPAPGTRPQIFLQGRVKANKGLTGRQPVGPTSSSVPGGSAQQNHRPATVKRRGSRPSRHVGFVGGPY